MCLNSLNDYINFLRVKKIIILRRGKNENNKRR